MSLSQVTQKCLVGVSRQASDIGESWWFWQLGQFTVSDLLRQILKLFSNLSHCKAQGLDSTPGNTLGTESVSVDLVGQLALPISLVVLPQHPLQLIEHHDPIGRVCSS